MTCLKNRRPPIGGRSLRTCVVTLDAWWGGRRELGSRSNHLAQGWQGTLSRPRSPLLAVSAGAWYARRRRLRQANLTSLFSCTVVYWLIPLGCRPRAWRRPERTRGLKDHRFTLADKPRPKRALGKSLHLLVMTTLPGRAGGQCEVSASGGSSNGCRIDRLACEEVVARVSLPQAPH